jgi:NADPH:quinone reductase-like Zn-dependent oxidoreductase
MIITPPKEVVAMKAFVRHAYGSPDLLRMEEVQRPLPAHGEVLVKVRATSVNAGDWHLLRGRPFPVRLYFGLRKPKHTILGSAVAGHVEAVGPNVKQLRAGDEVFGDLSDSGFGAFAEHVSAPEDALVLKPANVTFEEAAAVPVSATTALQGLRDRGKVRPGQKVLIHGASGGVGTFAVQIARALGAEVTAVCSTRNVETVRSIGADHVVDYTREDVAASGKMFDVILAVAGNRPIMQYKRMLRPGGIFVAVGGSGPQMSQSVTLGPWISIFGDRKVIMLLARAHRGSLEFVKQLLESKKIVPVIDRRYSFDQLPDALRYVEEGHARGKVVVAV